MNYENNFISPNWIKNSVRLFVLLLSVSSYLACENKEKKSKEKKSVSEVSYKREIIFGTIGEDPLEEIAEMQILTDYLNASKAIPEVNFKATASQSIQDMETKIMNGAINVLY